MAPELLGLGVGKSHPIPSATDMWALGEIVYRMLTRQSPFKDLVGLMEYCKNGDLFPTAPLRSLKISSSAEDFNRACMRPVQDDRITSDHALKHGWISNGQDRPVMEALPTPLRSGSLTIPIPRLLQALLTSRQLRKHSRHVEATRRGLGSRIRILEHLAKPAVSVAPKLLRCGAERDRAERTPRPPAAIARTNVHNYRPGGRRDAGVRKMDHHGT